MSGKKIIGRAEEIRILEQYYESERSELVAVYGRRRVGKTYLVQETLGERFDFQFIGLNKTPAAKQRKLFQKELNLLTGNNDSVPKDWFEAFDNLKSYLLSLKKKKVAIFLDELPWMDTPRSNFLGAFSYFWNRWGQETVNLKLYVCGSSTTWMLDKMIGDKGGLYGRTTRPVYLAPFTLGETEAFLNELKFMNFGRKQILDTYMVLGGIPYYLDMLDRELPLTVNIDRLFFSEHAPLRMEYEFLFRSLFNDSVNYRKVIEYLSSGLKGRTREEISVGCDMSGGELSEILRNLEKCDFIRSYTEPGKVERSKMYQLSDLFSLFHLRFVQRSKGQDEQYWSNMSRTGKKNAWNGYAFEQVCLHHVSQIKSKLGISGILSNTYSWSHKPFVDKDGTEWKGAQIDLIIDRADSIMNICEMKYSQDEFVIDKEYNDTVRSRMELFRKTQKTRKDLRCTFITTYGVKTNKYSGIVDNQIVLDDLFA